MNANQNHDRMQVMKAAVDPWYQALADPAKAQDSVLESLLAHYRQTDYGKEHDADAVSSYADYKHSFPVQTYAGFKPFIDQVLAGNTHALLSAEPLYMGLTKGTTGEPKLFPFTPDHVRIWREIHPRIIFNYSLTKRNFEWLAGYRLNLTSSAKIGTIRVGDKEMKYGYSIAVAASIIEESGAAALKVAPTQDEMDTLPKEATKENWETRYEFAYEKAREKDVTYIMTDPHVIVNFGRYIQRKHKVTPKDLWHVSFIMSGGRANTHTRYTPAIHALYGASADVRETYTSTEAAMGAQIDDKRAWAPFYDKVFFEVQTIDGVKPMHEMIPGEIGGLVLSTTSLPRYRIGDLILAFEPPYFHCIGRENTKLYPYSYGKLTGKGELNLSKSPELPTWR